jgi:hypothetical protein
LFGELPGHHQQCCAGSPGSSSSSNWCHAICMQLWCDRCTACTWLQVVLPSHILFHSR